MEGGYTLNHQQAGVARDGRRWDADADAPGVRSSGGAAITQGGSRADEPASTAAARTRARTAEGREWNPPFRRPEPEAKDERTILL